MNNKGWYAPFLVAVVIISTITLYGQLQKKTDALDYYIGDRQQELLGLNNDVKLYEVYVREAARLAIQQTVNDVAALPNYQGLTSPRGIALQYCVQLNSYDEPEDFYVTPHIQDGITEAFNKNINGYLERYTQHTDWQIPKNAFELYVSQNTLTGVAVTPSTFTIRDFTGRTIGEASYKPTFKITYDHGFDRYPHVYDTFEAISRDCSYSDDPESCARAYLEPSWQLSERNERLYQFEIPRGTTNSCYLLYLPGKPAQPST